MKRSLGPQTILHPHPVLLVGSYKEDGTPNIMTASWAGICCSKPPCVGVSLRKATLTYHNIMARRAYTVSIPSTRHVREADYAGMVSGRDVNKFEQTGLTPVASDLVDAPFVAECPVVLECRVLHCQELGLHTQFVAEILDVKADDDVLDERGQPDITRIAPFAYATGNRAYFAIGQLLQDGFVSREL